MLCEVIVGGGGCDWLVLLEIEVCYLCFDFKGGLSWCYGICDIGLKLLDFVDIFNDFI